MWNERYAQPGYFFGTKPAQFLVEHRTFLKPGDKALAIADGEGRNSVFLAKNGLKVTASDFSEVAIEKAKELAAKNNTQVDFKLADLETWDWKPESFDLVVAVFIQFAGPRFRKEIFAGMQKTLRPGGTLLLHGYTPRQISFATGGPRAVENLYTTDMLKEDFSSMQIIKNTAYERMVDEGQGHSGMSALIDFVAVKAP